jgi:hypothetical protein
VEDREVEGHEVKPPLLPKGSEATGRLPEYGRPKLRSLDISVPCVISCLLLAVRGEGGATGPLKSCRNRSTTRSSTFSGSTFLSASFTSSHDGIIGGGVPMRGPTTGTATTRLMAGSAVGVRRRVGAGGAALGLPASSAPLPSPPLPALGPPASSALTALAAEVGIARR